MNELKREDNQPLNKTIVYSYDAGGNFVNRIEYPYTTGTPVNPTKTYSYTYDSAWKDKMTGFDGKALTYDQIGNPLSYDGWTYTWEMGRQLAAMSKTGQSLSFKYNDAGIRTEKIYNGVTTKYHLVGDKVTYQDDGTDKIYFTYDASGKLISMNLNGTEYYYIFNGQGDIIGLFDSTGTQVVSYTYDTWGKLVSTAGTLASTVGAKNPYRYRGYRFDTETGLYYLQSRYYNPEWGRFINADSTLVAGPLLYANLFAYCMNNPVNMIDEDGDFAILIVAVVAVVICIAVVCVSAQEANNSYSYDWSSPHIPRVGKFSIGGSTPASPDPDNWNKNQNKKTPNISDKQVGKKLSDHASDYGLDISKEGAASYKNITQNVLKNATEIRVGNWKTLGKCEFWIYNYNVAIVQGGEWVSTFPLSVEGTINYIMSLPLL